MALPELLARKLSGLGIEENDENEENMMNNSKRGILRLGSLQANDIRNYRTEYVVKYCQNTAKKMI